jgi:type IV pilus modification protein PilV
MSMTRHVTIWPRSTRTHALHRQGGATLIEILFSMLIGGIAVLGIAVAQARALSLQIDSENRRVATQLIAQLRERVSANQPGYGQALGSPTGYTQTLSVGAAVVVPNCANASACDPATEVPGILVAQWFRDLQRQLPSPAARLRPTDVATARTMTVSVGWQEPNATTLAPHAACAEIPQVANDPTYRCITLVFFPG